MLKKSPFSPAQPLRAKTRLFPRSVLASLRDSTHQSVRLASSLAAALPVERRVSARRGRVGVKSSFFEHPAGALQLFMTSDGYKIIKSSKPALVHHVSIGVHRRGDA